MNNDELDQLIQLSRLEVSDRESIKQDLARVLEWVSSLDALECDDKAPLVHPGELTQPLREDQAGDVIGPRGLAGAARVEDDMVLVPGVIK